MPSRAAAPPGRIPDRKVPMSLIGYRAMERPVAIAACPTHKLLAAATAAPGGGSIDLVRLWKEEGEQKFHRPLKAVASIRDCGGAIHRLAWSRRSGKYELGLLAGGLDSGVVCIWDTSAVLYEPNIDTAVEELSDGRRVSWRYDDSSDDEGYVRSSLGSIIYDLYGEPNPLTVVAKAPEIRLEKEIEEAVPTMHRYLDHLIEEHVAKERPGKVNMQSEMKEHEQEKDWELIQKEDIVATPGQSLRQVGDCLLLKLNSLNGPVLGLSFNCHYPNMLACAAYGEKLRVYYLDVPDEFASRGDEDSTQMTFLDWNPVCPAVLLSTCDTGMTKLWDLREKSSKSTYMRDLDKGLNFSEVHWNPSDPLMFALASKDNCESPIKIWDVRNNKEVMYEFGNTKGVTSLSWSTSGLIITTAVDGFVDYWERKQKEKVPVSWSSMAAGFHEARWCQFDATLAAAKSQNLEVYRMPAGHQCIWRD